MPEKQTRPSVPKDSPKSVGKRQSPGDKQGVQTPKRGAPANSTTR